MKTPNPGGKSRSLAIDLPTACRALSAIEADESGLTADRDSEYPQIPGYIIDSRLGAGAGGVVYRALRTGSDQFVALKLLNQRLGESPDARRAWRELDMLAQLRLPAIPRLLDHGEHDGHIYLVTDFIDGVRLLDYADERKLKVRERVELLANVADALLSLHEFGVIHRDIKPQNILINKHGQPVLVDLGIATLLAHDAMETLTQDGTPIGTPAFMSPEQARGETRIISTRSDLYCLGATAYMLLTGHTPHAMDVTIHEAIRRVAHDPPREPRELYPSLPKPLAAILRKAVAERPEDRYESAAAMAADFRRWLHGEPVEAGGLSLTQRFGRLTGRHPLATTATACVLIAVLTLTLTAASVWWLNMRPNALEIDPVNREWVRLVSHSGRELYRWDAGEVVSATLVDRPMELGGGRIVLIRFGGASDPRISGQLCVFDLSNPAELLWASGEGDAAFDMPTPISMNKGDAMITEWVITEDVFSESPGVEIIAGHRNALFSAMTIRVYSLEGRVLYEVWHDGGTVDGHWLAEPRLIVTCGFNSEGIWAQRDYADRGDAIWPVVVFALRPEFGKRHHEWLHTPGGLGTFAPVWYWCLFPPEEIGRFKPTAGHMKLFGPPHLSNSGVLVQWDVPAHGEHGILHLVLDSDGRIVDRFTSDAYRAAGDALPDPSIFSLQPLPPLIREDADIETDPFDSSLP